LGRRKRRVGRGALGLAAARLAALLSAGPSARLGAVGGPTGGVEALSTGAADDRARRARLGRAAGVPDPTRLRAPPPRIASGARAGTQRAAAATAALSGRDLVSCRGHGCRHAGQSRPRYGRESDKQPSIGHLPDGTPVVKTTPHPVRQEDAPPSGVRSRVERGTPPTPSVGSGDVAGESGLDFGASLPRERLRAGLSQHELAQPAGMRGCHDWSAGTASHGLRPWCAWLGACDALPLLGCEKRCRKGEPGLGLAVGGDELVAQRINRDCRAFLDRHGPAGRAARGGGRVPALGTPGPHVAGDAWQRAATAAKSRRGRRSWLILRFFNTSPST
jgi:hypothetical protein